MRGCMMVGCGVVAVVALAVGGGIGYFSFKISKSYQQGFERAAATNTEFPFTVPADGIVPAARFDAFLRVRAEASTPLRGAAERFDRAAQGSERGVVARVKSIFGAASELGDSFVATWDSLGASLREEHMSLAEMQWIERTIHASVICAARAGDKGALELVEAMKRHEPASEPDEEQNDERVGGGYEQLKERLGKDCKAVEPRNLALALSHPNEFTHDEIRTMIDLFVLDAEARNEPKKK